MHHGYVRAACFSATLKKVTLTEDELRKDKGNPSTTSETNRKVFGAFPENVTEQQICDRLKTATTKLELEVFSTLNGTNY